MLEKALGSLPCPAEERVRAGAGEALGSDMDSRIFTAEKDDEGTVVESRISAASPRSFDHNRSTFSQYSPLSSSPPSAASTAAIVSSSISGNMPLIALTLPLSCGSIREVGVAGADVGG